MIIRAIKFLILVLLVMAITACAQNRVPRPDLAKASVSIAEITRRATQSDSALPLVYTQRANQFMKAAGTAQHRGNYDLASMYARLALSEARVAEAATATGARTGSTERSRKTRLD